MTKRFPVVLICGLVLAAAVSAQYTPWLYWTFLPREQMDEIVGEASGETAWNTIAEINAFNRERFAEEFTGNFLETQVVVRKLRELRPGRDRRRDLSGERQGLGGRQGRALGDEARRGRSWPPSATCCPCSARAAPRPTSRPSSSGSAAARPRRSRTPRSRARSPSAEGNI